MCSTVRATSLHLLDPKIPHISFPLFIKSFIQHEISRTFPIWRQSHKIRVWSSDGGGGGGGLLSLPKRLKTTPPKRLKTTLPKRRMPPWPTRGAKWTGTMSTQKIRLYARPPLGVRGQTFWNPCCYDGAGRRGEWRWRQRWRITFKTITYMKKYFIQKFYDIFYSVCVVCSLKKKKNQIF